MALLIDQPRWPAHGTTFAHLVSDTSLLELFEFADANGLPVRGFDHDHYDVPADRHAQLVAAGAHPVAATELLRRLILGGLRVRSPERTPKREQVEPRLRAAWAQLLPGSLELGDQLLGRWAEPHRHYHDTRHLMQVLDALGALGEAAASRPVVLAAWFHDAVYEGRAGDEERSAELAAIQLSDLGLPEAEVEEVVRLVLLTASHRPDPGDQGGARLVDADLSVLGQIPGRYHYYARSVRLEHPGFDDLGFAEGRLRVLADLAGREALFHTRVGQRLWSVQAGENLAQERERWSRTLALAR